MKKYRIGKKQKRALLDDKGHEVAIFSKGREEDAKRMCKVLNEDKINFKKLLKRNYNSIVKRGLISEKTTLQNFIDKSFEELRELDAECEFYNDEFDVISKDFHEVITDNDIKKIKLELADNILVLFNFATHFNIDVLEILNEKIKINETRKD